MDIVQRLIFCLVLLACPLAFADSCPSSYYAQSYDGSVRSWAGPVSTNTIEALTFACQQLDPTWQSSGSTSIVNGSLTANCGRWLNGVWEQWAGRSASVGLQKKFQAPSGAWVATDPGTCSQPTCPSNQEYDSEVGSCQCKSIPNAGSFMVTGDHYDGCNEGCAMVLSSGWYDKTANTTWGSWSQSGFTCTAGTPSVLTSNDPKVEAAKQCAAGTCPGTVNGQSVCVPCDKTKQTQSTTSSTSSSSTASGATSSTTTSETGSESSQTSCKDGSCTTTTTTTTVGPNGDKVDKTTTKTEPQSDYCTQNPKAPVCKGTESSWGGTCDAFTCEGDAVQCAQAKGAWELACTLKTDSTSQVVQTGLQAVAGTLSDSKPVETTASIGQFNTQNPYSGTCPQDVTVSVWGKSFGIPLSQTCSWIQAIGWFLVAGATLAGARIAFT